MKYLITESKLNNIVSKYLDNQDFKKISYGTNFYFVNSENDELAQIKFNYNSKWCTISRGLMSEVANFFSLTNIDSISTIDEWVKNKLDDNPQAVHVENEIIVRYF
jgi:hypothetical protein